MDRGAGVVGEEVVVGGGIQRSAVALWWAVDMRSCRCPLGRRRGGMKKPSPLGWVYEWAGL